MRQQLRGRIIILLFILFFLMNGCISSPPERDPGGIRTTEISRRINRKDTGWIEETAPEKENKLNKAAASIVEAFTILKGLDQPFIDGKAYPSDCTGAVLAMYDHAGINLLEFFPQYQGNGVSRIYQHMQDKNLLHRRSTPEVGDLIFWDNTWDRNEDGLWNDSLTHIGVVIDTRSDGTIVYAHMNYRNGIVAEYMNLQYPDTYMEDGTIVNSPMRMKGEPEGEKWLASQLFRGFGQAWKL